MCLVSPGPETCMTFSQSGTAADLDSFLDRNHCEYLQQKRSRQPANPLVDMILDKAGQKGTGRWTLQSAIEQAVVVSTINAAVEARRPVSHERATGRSIQTTARPRRKFNYPGDRQTLIDAVRDGAFTRQKSSPTPKASSPIRGSQQTIQLENLHYGDIATILAGRMYYPSQVPKPDKGSVSIGKPNLENLMLDPFFKGVLANTQTNWRTAVSFSDPGRRLLSPPLAPRWAYFDSYRSERLPANLLQSATGLFSEHIPTRRVDKTPAYSTTEWLKHLKRNSRKRAQKRTQKKG